MSGHSRRIPPLMNSLVMISFLPSYERKRVGVFPSLVLLVNELEAFV